MVKSSSLRKSKQETMPLKKHNKVRRDKVPRKQDDAEDVPESEEVEMLKEKIQETAVPSGSQISR